MFSSENRTKAEGLIGRYPVKRSALLPLLHLVQYQDGYVSDEGIAECAELLDLTKAEVAAVSTFYTMYKREPMGRHLVSVCTNFSCAVRGGKEVFDRLSEHLGVGHNQTTEDEAITLEHAECLGNCEGAPLVTVDYINYEMLSGDDAVGLVDALRDGEVPEPTRGMVPPGIRAASHRLAGIGPIDPDGPGQRLGLARAEHGAVPTDDSGPGIATGVIDLTPATGSDNGSHQGGTGSADDTQSDVSTDEGTAEDLDDTDDDQAKEVAAPDSAERADSPAAAGTDDAASQAEHVKQSAAAEGLDAEEIAEQAAPSGADPATHGAEDVAPDAATDGDAATEDQTEAATEHLTSDTTIKNEKATS